MAASEGPNILIDGLVLALDAANIKSFRGESTVNLHSTYSTGIDTTLVGVSPISAACGYGGWSWCAYGGAYTFDYMFTVNPYGLMSNVGNLKNSTTGGDYRMDIILDTTTLNRTFTFSVWVKNNGGSVTSMQITMATNGDSNGAGQVFSLTNDWQRFVYTRTFTGTCTTNIRTYFFSLTAGSNILLYGAQLEEKDHVTPFVNGTRGTTVATDGGWKDLSVYNNSGELTGTFTSSYDGLIFNGTTSVITLGKSPSQIGIYDNSYTAECVCYPTELTGDRGMFGGGENAFAQGMHLVFRNGTIYMGHYASDYGAGSVQINNWYHIVFRFNKINSGASIFKNGVNQGNGSVSAFIGNGNMFIGGAISGTSPFQGKISLSKIYNTALSDIEILQNFNAIKSRFGI